MNNETENLHTSRCRGSVFDLNTNNISALGIRQDNETLLATERKCHIICDDSDAQPLWQS